MSDQIKPGDLVMVVRPTICCGNGSAIGTVGIAHVFGMCAMSECSYCGHIGKTYGLEILIDSYAYDLVRLKKIDPPALCDDVELTIELEHA